MNEEACGGEEKRTDMATNHLTKVLVHTRRVALRHDGSGLTDGELLGDFLNRHDEAAFEALVRRHGPMVLSVCRRIVGNLHDAEDAFQATFLVLACKAASIMPREAVGNWLYGVAYRTALKARTTTARRRARERQGRDMPQTVAQPQAGREELELLLDQELHHLPDKYRLPIVLCDLEGRTRRAVARQLGLPDGTLSNRLATGRRMLARRLTRRGLAGLGAVAATTLVQNVAAASVPPSLLLTTVQAASLMAAGVAVKAVVSAPVAALMKGELKSMLLTKLKLVTGVLLVAAVTGLSQSGGPAAPPKLPAQPTPAQQPAVGPNQRFPAPAQAKAFVQRDGETALRVRAELPMGRFVKLLDADGKAVHIHEFVHWQPAPFTIDLGDARVYDTRGRARPQKEWITGLTGETLVLLEFRAGAIDAAQMAEAYRLYRADLDVLVLPPAVAAGLDSAKAFAPAKSLPQLFPGGNRGPGDPKPPRN
jgi:RNA polymerase sigma factor (sigma-70 family)